MLCILKQKYLLLKLKYQSIIYYSKAALLPLTQRPQLVW